MNNWLRQHGFALAGALRHMRHAPGGFLFNIVVIAIALALPFTGATLLDNVRPMSEQLSVDPELSVFLQQELARPQAEALAVSLRQLLRERQAKIIFVPREKALDQLKTKSGLSDVLATLGDNPLPDSYILKLDAFRNAEAGGDVDALAEQIRALPGVDTVQVDSAWVKRLAALLGVLRLALLLLALTLGTVVVAVIFNTIRLQVLTQREEISVAKLIGASDSFIHRPFYYSGALLGLCAGALALGGVTLALHPLNNAIAEFARLYASEFQLVPLAPLPMAGLLALSAGLGLAGAVLSVQRHLARLN